MLRLLVERMGADYVQWRALTAASLKLDMRAGGGLRRGSSGRGWISSWWTTLVWFTLLGLVVSPMILHLTDVFFSASFFISYVMVMVGAIMLLDFGAVIVSPDDFAILGYQPVDSRTYFLSRLTNALIYGWVVTLAVGLAPLVSFFFTEGGNPVVGVAAVAATFGASTTVVLALLLAYVGILRVVRPEKMRRALTTLQFGLSFLVYGAYSVIPRLVNAETIGAFSLEKKPVIFLLPSTWFASIVGLARRPDVFDSSAGRWSAIDWVPALAAVVSVVVLFQLARGRLSLSYAQRLADAAAVSEPVKAPARTGPARAPSRWSLPVFSSGEERATALLVSRQFKHDTRFRLTVLSFIPVTLLSLYLAMDEGRPPDPFADGNAGMGGAWVLYWLAIMIPVMVRKSFVSSDAFEASWIFYVTPADIGRLVLSVKKVLLATFLVPYLLFLTAILAWLFGNPLHAFLQAILVGLFAHLILQFITIFEPDLPFSMSPRKGERGFMFLVVMLPAMILGGGGMYVAQRWVYPHPAWHAGLLAGLLLLTWFLERLVRVRVHLTLARRGGTAA